MPETNIMDKYAHKYSSNHTSSQHEIFQAASGKLQMTCEDMDMVINSGHSAKDVKEMSDTLENHMVVTVACSGCGKAQKLVLSSDEIFEWMQAKGYIVEEDQEGTS